MENLMKDTFDKIHMDDNKKVEIRASIERRSLKRFLEVKYVACAAICMVVLLCVPATRTAIIQAAVYVKQIFYTADGKQISYEETDNELRFTIETGDESYTKVENGRLFFVLGNKCIDITNKCSETSYYKHEVVNSDGSRSVILVGGTTISNGWVELLFDADGNYVFNKMNVEENAPWVNLAMHNEGVPTGDIQLDKKLKD